MAILGSSMILIWRRIMTDYESMSDFEINKAVAKAQGRLLEVPKGMLPEVIGDVRCYYDEQRVIWQCHFGYCDSPDDAWPIIVDKNISLSSPLDGGYLDQWKASKDCVDAECFNVNPLRAAMIVYLMMQENDND
jgi:hypothetical protein